MTSFKRLLFFSVLLLAFSANSQKYKKERLLLLEELEQLASSGDSICRTYNQRLLFLSDSLDRELPKGMYQLSDWINQNDRMMTFNRSKMQKLEKLNRVPQGYSAARLDSVGLRTASDLSEEYDDLYLKKPEQCKWVPIAPNGLSLKPKKSDVPYLKQQIEIRRSEKDRLLRQLEEYTYLIQRKQHLLSNLQRETKLASEQHQFLVSFYTQLDNAHVAAAYEFADKGPSGFSQAFFDEFPAFFPDGKRSKFPIVMPYWVMEKEHNDERMSLESDDLSLKVAPPAPKSENELFRLGAGVDNIPPPPPPVRSAEGDNIFTYVDVPAEFPGGGAALKAYLANNIVYPESARTAGIQGTCYVQFIVSAKGNVSNVVVKRGIPDCPECDNETKRVVKAMPQWKPGEINGKPVNSTFSLPVKFKLPAQQEQK